MILYAVIARAKDGAVLVESIVAGIEGNFPHVTVEVLERIVSSANHTSSVLLPDGGKRTFVQRRDLPMFGGLFSGVVATQWTCFGYNNADDMESQAMRGGGNGDVDYYFHMCRKDNVICLCISDDIDARHHAVNYDFLDDVEAKFTKSYAPFRVTKAKAYEMDKKFNKELGKLIYFYNENRQKMVMNDKVGDLLVKVDDLKGLLGSNITVVLERDRYLTDLIERSDNMVQDSKVFTKRSSKLKAKVQREYYFYYIIAFLFGVLVLYLLFAELCGYTGRKCSSTAESSGEE
ncbi:hypothetical protein ACHAXA_009565 [Cyclostephanos tholiformis]|uniref:Uncharacterized protein n=1 Tax=Cyclostephanos tholiformis TaxID=382380 RepID=A0ABD3SDT7_9STRA